jgi:hypothetical protein
MLMELRNISYIPIDSADIAITPAVTSFPETLFTLDFIKYMAVMKAANARSCKKL